MFMASLAAQEFLFLFCNHLPCPTRPSPPTAPGSWGWVGPVKVPGEGPGIGACGDPSAVAHSELGRGCRGDHGRGVSMAEVGPSPALSGSPSPAVLGRWAQRPWLIPVAPALHSGPASPPFPCMSEHLGRLLACPLHVCTRVGGFLPSASGGHSFTPAPGRDTAQTGHRVRVPCHHCVCASRFLGAFPGRDRPSPTASSLCPCHTSPNCVRVDVFADSPLPSVAVCPPLYQYLPF